MLDESMALCFLCPERHQESPGYEGTKVEPLAVYIRLYQQRQSGSSRFFNWELLSRTKLICLPLSSPPSFLHYSLPSLCLCPSLAVLNNSYCVRHTPAPPGRPSSLFLSQSSPWCSPRSVCAQNQSRAYPPHISLSPWSPPYLLPQRGCRLSGRQWEVTWLLFKLGDRSGSARSCWL